MSTSAIVVIVVVVVVVLVLAAVAARIMVQRRELRERYGDEYQRVVTEKGGRAAAEAELKRREREHDRLELKELPPAVREEYRASWTTVQSQFVDDPKAAVHAADRLVSQLVADRGYPVVDYPQRLEHLSVEHSSVLNTYRSAHDISVRNDAGAATTEELRQALVSYRELIADLLGDRSLADAPASTAADIAPDTAPVEMATPPDAPAMESPVGVEDAAQATPPELAVPDPEPATMADEGRVEDDRVDANRVDEGRLDDGTVDDGTVDDGTVDDSTVDEGTVDRSVAEARADDELSTDRTSDGLDDVEDPDAVRTPAARERDNG
jgi:hypothetical protein